jgi:hypothetical protein
VPELFDVDVAAPGCRKQDLRLRPSTAARAGAESGLGESLPMGLEFVDDERPERHRAHTPGRLAALFEHPAREPSLDVQDARLEVDVRPVESE